jgi:DNA-directed RNA polymerase subunit K/omega
VTDSSIQEIALIQNPAETRFAFVKIASLRAAQLMRGCTPRVAVSFKVTRTAQREVAEGKVSSLPREVANPPA